MENTQTDNQPITVNVKINIHLFKNVQFTLKNEEVKSYAGMIEERTLQFELKPKDEDYKKMKEKLGDAISMYNPFGLQIFTPTGELVLKVKSFSEDEYNKFFFIIAENE